MNTIGSRAFWVPGWRQAAFFLLLVSIGLGAWVFRIAAGLRFDPPGILDEAFDTGVILYALIAFAAGFVSPKGFYLWGMAVVLTHPLAALVLTAYQQSQGADIVRGGTLGWFDFAFVLVMMTVTSAMLMTVLSAAGAGLRLLLDRPRQGRSGTPQHVRAR